MGVGINKFAQLAQGFKDEGIDVTGMDVVDFIPHEELPQGETATRTRRAVDCRPEKCETWRLRITRGDDKLDCVGDVTTHSASMETVKCKLNKIVSTLSARCATGDVSNVHLGSLLPDAECVQF